ncbi:MAG: hypothetical protein MUF34_17500 [Polyangiaceae bacterium]|jgi:heme-degrading monooxygenase HmoA|nr:hypothetical protein [Polyangiaceae bacterium]
MLTLSTSYFQRTLRRNLAALACSLAMVGATTGAVGCNDSDDDDNPGAAGTGAGAGGAPGGSQPTKYAGCERGVLEADLVGGAQLDVLATRGPQWQGPGVDPATGALRPGNYVISSTYLTLRTEAAAQQRFGELMGILTEDFQTRPGLVALALSVAGSCDTARTLSVWESEEAMYAFVSSPAHTAAISGARDVSRGQSAVTHWSGTEADATWPKGAEALSRDEGLGY